TTLDDGVSAAIRSCMTTRALSVGNRSAPFILRPVTAARIATKRLIRLRESLQVTLQPVLNAVRRLSLQLGTRDGIAGQNAPIGFMTVIASRNMVLDAS